MASKYARRMVVPSDFAETLKGFAREVLRQLPKDVDEDAAEAWIYNFGASYFSNAASTEPAPAFLELENLTRDELEAKLVDLFLEADADNSGTLDHREFKTVFRKFADELGFPKADVRRIMAEADENESGAIEYHEFARAAGDVIQAVLARTTYETLKATREESAVEKSRNFLLHNLSPDQLEKVLGDMFTRADGDGSGTLSRSEFHNALKQSGLGLTRKEINILLHEVDENEDGNVSYQEFLPLCFNLLVEIVSQQFEASEVPRDEAELKDFFTDLFAAADVEGNGLLAVADIAALLDQAELGLSTIQQSAILAEARTNDDGLVEYARFAGDAATIIAAIIDLQFNESRAEAVIAARSSSERTVLGMNEAEFTDALSTALGEADTEGTGMVHYADAKAVLVSDLGLTDKQSNGVIIHASQDGEGNVSIADVAAGAFAVLLNIEELEKLKAGEW